VLEYSVLYSRLQKCHKEVRSKIRGSLLMSNLHGTAHYTLPVNDCIGMRNHTTVRITNAAECYVVLSCFGS
jgi:hypothetical protein